VLKQALQADTSYAWSWHCNVAMQFVDRGGDHRVANEAAAAFMSICFDVDVKHSPEWLGTFKDIPNMADVLSAQARPDAEDSAMLDWLSQQFVTVRIPLPYGSRPCFLGSPDDNDGWSSPWDIRSKIRAAMASDAGVKS
jgi:hypothetical protein